MFALEKRQGNITSITRKIKKSTHTDKNTGKTSAEYTLHMHCELNGEKIKLVTGHFGDQFTEGDYVTAYGVTSLTNKFKVFAILNLSQNNQLSLGKYSWRQILAGMSGAWIVMLISRVNQLADDKMPEYLAVIFLSILITVILLRKPYLMSNSIKKLEVEFNVERPISLLFPWWGLSAFITGLFTVIGYFNT